jgi:glycosyltransferase involved in cell wall biosynthesis
VKPFVFVVGARGIPDVEGGAEKNAEMLFPLVAAGGYRVVLTGLADNIKSDSFKGVELRRAPRSKLMKTDKLLYYITAIFMAARLRPQIVHMQGLGSAMFLWAYKLMGMKTVVRYGSADYLVAGKWGLLGRLGFLFSEFQLRFADAVISVTPALATRLAERGVKGNVHVIPNAVDPRAVSPDAPPIDLPHEPYVLAVGRITAQKNVDTLARGFAAFAKDNPGEFRLMLAGGLDDEPYVAALKPLIGPDTTLMGRVQRSAMGPLYAGARVYVNSSIHEGSSNAVLEAISWGAPILLSGIPENRDFGLAEHHYFDPLDPQAIASALRKATTDPAAYTVDLNRFLTWSTVAERTMAIYRRCLPDRAPEPTPSELPA